MGLCLCFKYICTATEANDLLDAFDGLQWIQICQIYYQNENVPAQLKHCPHLINETPLRQTSEGIRTFTYVYLQVVSTEYIPWEVQMDQAAGDGWIGTQWLAKAVHP